MIKNIKKINEVTFITFPLLEKIGIRHGFSTKLGGVSKGDCASMNLSFHRGDDAEAVMKNHQLFANALGYDERRLVFSDQVHKTCIRTVTEEDCGKGIVRPSDLLEVDGLVTEGKNVPLITFYADCVPLFFADPVRKVVGMAHSGWRGTVARIGEEMVKKMEREFGCQKENIYAVVGPSICQDCYEVSADVAAIFQKEFSNRVDEILKPGKQDKYQLDLWKTNEGILLEAGLKKENVEVCGICTCCNHDVLFSHRYTNGKRGNLGGVIWL